MDKEEKRAYDREYHANRSPEKKARKLQLQKDRSERNLILLRQYKQSKGCMDCGESDPIVLEMDHRNRDDKNFAIGDKSSLGFSLLKCKRNWTNAMWFVLIAIAKEQQNK